MPVNTRAECLGPAPGGRLAGADGLNGIQSCFLVFSGQNFAQNIAFL